MAFRLTPEAQARVAEYRSWADERKSEFANLTDESLVASAKLYMHHMTPLRFAPGEPVYDATMWHIILPELLKRLQEKP